MPYPFVLPTTSAFAFSAVFACPTHPSLLRNASTYRGVVRDTLKRHKRLPPEAQAANLGLVISSLRDYLPYLFAVVDGLAGRNGVRVTILGRETTGAATTSTAVPDSQALPDDDAGARRGRKGVTVSASAAAAVPGSQIEWRPVLADSRIPGKEPPRVRIRLPAPGAHTNTAADRHALDAEVAFALAALGHAYTLQARAALQPLYVVTSVVPVGADQRLAAITAATKHLLAAAGVFALAAAQGEAAAAVATAVPPAAEITSPVLRALAALAIAEATLLAVLKDDPYAAAVAQDRNEHDREWMYKAPDLPKVRAHLFARLCLAAADHAQTAAASVGATGTATHIAHAFGRYLDDLRCTSRAKACRFFAIDAELGAQTGTALAYIHAALHELGDDNDDAASGIGTAAATDGSSGRILRAGDAKAKAASLLGRLRRERSERREERRIERGAGWGADAGRFEETRVLAMLDAKWTKQNDTINTQRIPPSVPLLAQLPSGREIHMLRPLDRPALDATTLDAMRAPPDPLDALADDVDGLGVGAADSSDEEAGHGPPATATASGHRSASTLGGGYASTPSAYY